MEKNIKDLRISSILEMMEPSIGVLVNLLLLWNKPSGEILPMSSDVQ